MSNGRPWMTSEVRILQEMRSRRVRTSEIAKALGRTENAIYSFLRYVPASNGMSASMGRIPPRPKAEKKPTGLSHWNEREVKRLRELAEGGATMREACEVLGKSMASVRTKAYRDRIRFGGHGRCSIYRLEHESNMFRANAIEGSAQLRDAILTALAA